jgi:hypothetical protein
LIWNYFATKAVGRITAKHFQQLVGLTDHLIAGIKPSGLGIWSRPTKRHWGREVFGLKFHWQSFQRHITLIGAVLLGAIATILVDARMYLSAGVFGFLSLEDWSGL